MTNQQLTNHTLLKLCIWLCREDGKPLDMLRQKLLAQALDGIRLRDIYVDGFSPRYVRQIIAPKVWKQLERYCGQRVSIRRLQLVLSQKYHQLSPKQREAVEQIEIDRSTFAWVSPDEKKKLAVTNQGYSSIPLNPCNFYNHRRTIRHLSALLKRGQQALIFVFGSGGIGKTTLVSHTLYETREFATKTIWCNLSENADFQQNLDFIWAQWEITDQSDTEGDRQNSDADDIELLCRYLQQHDNILVFDHWESLFTPEDFSGTYQPQHQSYDLLLTKLTQQPLKGRVIVISQEVAPCMEQWSQKSTVVSALTVPPLADAAAFQILREYQLQDEHLWQKFVQPYCGNPLNLRLISTEIREWFGGSIAQFKRQNTIIGGDTLRNILQALIQHINPLEQEILYWLMLWVQPVTVGQLQEDYPHDIAYPTQLWDAVRSLERRFLLEKIIQENPPLLTLQPSIQRYLAQTFTQICHTEIMQAIADGYDPNALDLFNRYQLAANDTPEAMLLSPVLQPLLKSLNYALGATQVQFHLTQLRNEAVAHSPEHYLIIKNVDFLLQYSSKCTP